MPHGQRHDGRGGEEGLVEGAERHVLCGSEQVAQAQQREQVRVDINGKDKYGQTPLFHASLRGMVEVVRTLVEAGQT